MLAFSKIFQFRPQVKTQKNIYIFLKVTNLTKIKTSLPSTAHILLGSFYKFYSMDITN